MENEHKEIQKAESRHDVQIAVMANDMKHISKGIDDMRQDIKNLSQAFVKTADFETWKGQEYDELRKKVNDHADILVKHTVSITRIMTYGIAIISVLGAIEVGLSIYKSVIR